MKHYSKVFIVTADAASAESLEAALSTAGYCVRSFSSGETFLRFHHPTQVGVLVINLPCPDMNASTLIERLQADDGLMSVILLGSEGFPANFHQEDPQSVARLPKPFETTALISLIDDGIALSVWRRSKQMRNRPADAGRY